MRIPMTAMMILCALNTACAQWVGNGSYETPYQYTSPVAMDSYFIDRRGQTIVNDPPTVVGNEELSDSHYQQVHSRELFMRANASDPFLQIKHEGTSQDREYSGVKTKNAAGIWNKTFESFTDESGVLIEFQDPTNPNQVIGVPKYVTMESTMHMDVNGDTGDLTVKLLVQKANPNQNNDPPADTWVFNFTFDLPDDTWTASVTRKVNGTQDILGFDMGTWNPYGAGTHIFLPVPNQPLSNTQADWYLDGTNTDYAWTMLNNVHYHPGPIQFSFTPYTDTYLTHYKP